MVTDDADREQVLRDKAVRRLKKQRDFRSHLLVCLPPRWHPSRGAGPGGRVNSQHDAEQITQRVREPLIG